MNRFKPIIFVGVILSMIIMFIGVNSSTVLAAHSEKEEYGLKVTMTTDKDDYGKDENIKAVFDFQNNGEKTIKEIQLINEIPDGYTVVDEEIKQQIGDINPGEKKQASVTYVPVVDSNQGIVDNSIDNGKTPADTGKKMASNTVTNTPVTRAAGSITTSGAVASKTTPSTGDTSNVPVWAIVAISASGAAILSYFVIKKKAGGKVLAIILCTGIAGASVSGLSISKANAEEIPIYGGFNIRAMVNVDGEQRDLSSNVAFTTSYEDAGKNEAPDEEGDYTREQWLTEIFNNLGLEEWTGDYDLFDDVDDAENKNIINALIENEIVSVFTDEYNMDNVFPKNSLTREYLSETLNKALNLTLQDDIDTSSWRDVADIKDVNAAKKVVEAGIFSLENNSFYPNKIVTKKEYEKAQVFLHDMLENDKTETDEIVYKKDVPVTNVSAYVIDADNKKITLYDKTISKDWKAGELHVLVDDKNHTKDIAFRINSINDKGDSVVVIYEEPALDEVIESININRHESPTTFIPAEGVTVLSDSDEIDWDIDESEYSSLMDEENRSDTVSHEIQTTDSVKYDDLDITLAGIGDNHIADINERLPIALNGERVLNLEFSLGGKSKAICSIEDIALNISVKGEPFVSYAKVSIEKKAKIKLEGVNKEKKFKLGDFPFPTNIPGLNGAISLYLIVSAENKCTFYCTVTEETGAKYKDGFVLPVKNFSFGSFNFSSTTGCKAGLEIPLSARILNCFTLAEAGLEAAVKAEIELGTNFVNGFCFDGKVYPYISIFAKFLSNDRLKIEYELVNDNILKKGFHIEETGMVEECTRSNAYKGRLLSSEGQPIAKGKIVVKDRDGVVKNKVSSLDTGYFTGGKLTTGNYKIEISAKGHVAQVLDNVRIIEGSTLNLGTITLLSSGSNVSPDTSNNGMFSVKGTVSDSTNNSILTGAKISAVNASLGRNGEIVSQALSDSTGNYQLNVDAGTYKIVVEKDGYVNGVSQITVNRNIEGNNFSLSPSNQTIVTGNLRAVLKWGETPSDLDSHLVAKNTNDPFHVYYSEKNAGGIQILDVDDTDSFGPETITLNQANDGTYSYYVHDFSNRHEEDSNMMNLSEAYVEVYSGNTKINTFYIDDTQRGTLWHVFDYDAKTGRLTFVDQYSYQTDPGAVGGSYGGGMNDEVHEKVNLQIQMMNEDGEFEVIPEEDTMTLLQYNDNGNKEKEQHQELTIPTTDDNQTKETEEKQETQETMKPSQIIPTETSEPVEPQSIETTEETENVAA